MKTPITWVGGKHFLAKKLIEYFPRHITYVELFGGGASVLFQKPPSKCETFNDINGDLINFFRVLRDNDKFKKFYEIVNLIPYSRQEYYESIASLSEGSDVERAIKFFIVARMSFAGGFDSWAYSKLSSSNNMSQKVNSWLNTIKLLPEISERLKKVQIENRDYKVVMKNFNDPDIFIYADPPYLNTRSKFNTYKMWSEDEHSEFLDLCLDSKSKIMISGYYSDLYNEKLQGWNTKIFESKLYSAKKINEKRDTTYEYIWMNYDLQNKSELRTLNDFLK